MNVWQRVSLCGILFGAAAMAAEPVTKPKRTGDMVVGTTKVNKVLFLGNSITKHGPNESIGWSGNWGMAASSEANDYVHLVLAALAERCGRAPEARIVNIASFERQFRTYDIETRLADTIAFKPDLVIVAIGENVPALKSQEDHVAFKDSLSRLLNAFRSVGNPVFVVRSCFWASPVKDTILRQGCDGVGGIFADCTALGKDEKNYARSEREFSHKGVAAHPGDQGMRAIADVILQALETGRAGGNRK